MKFLILICFTAFALANAFSVHPILGLNGKLCAKMYVEPENLVLIRNMEFPDTPDTHQFLKCTFESIGLWNDETGYQVNMIDELLKDHDTSQKIKEEIARCTLETIQEDLAKWMYDAFLCVLDGPFGDEIINIGRSAQMENEGTD